MKVKWRAMPSVRAGGKSHFFISFSPGYKLSIVGTDSANDYVLAKNDSEILGHFNTASAAKRFVATKL